MSLVQLVQLLLQFGCNFALFFGSTEKMAAAASAALSVAVAAASGMFLAVDDYLSALL